MENTYFEEIYKKYYNKILAYVKGKVHDEQEALELTHDVFLKCYKSLDSFNPELSSIATWLYVIAGNCLKNHYRDKKEDRMDSVEIESAAVSEDDYVEQAVLLSDARKQLLENLKRLSKRERTVLVLKYYYGKKAKEIGEEMDLQAGNVRVIQKRALEKLKAMME